MKRIVLFSTLIITALACNSSAKTEQQEEKERDSTDKVQVDKDQRYVDSIMKAEEEKEAAAKDSSAQAH